MRVWHWVSKAALWGVEGGKWFEGDEGLKGWRFEGGGFERVALKRKLSGLRMG